MEELAYKGLLGSYLMLFIAISFFIYLIFKFIYIIFKEWLKECNIVEFFKSGRVYKINIFIAILVVALVVLLFFAIDSLYNKILDIPYVLSKNVIYDEVILLSGSYEGEGVEPWVEPRTVECRSLSTGEVFDLTIDHSNLYQGEIYKVVYLPNSKLGFIYEQLK